MGRGETRRLLVRVFRAGNPSHVRVDVLLCAPRRAAPRRALAALGGAFRARGARRLGRRQDGSRPGPGRNRNPTFCRSFVGPSSEFRREFRQPEPEPPAVPTAPSVSPPALATPDRRPRCSPARLRHCGDPRPALRTSAGTAAIICRRCNAQPALLRSAGTAATLGWHRSGQPLRVAHRRSTGRRQAALYMNLAVRVARPHFAATGCLPTARQVPC